MGTCGGVVRCYTECNKVYKYVRSSCPSLIFYEGNATDDVLHSVQHCTETPIPVPPCSFLDPHFVSITFYSPFYLQLFDPFSELRTSDPAQPPRFPAHSPSTLTENSIILSWTYSSPCCAHNPALFPVVIKVSLQCTVDPV